MKTGSGPCVSGNAETNKWQEIEPRMTTVVDLDTGQILVLPTDGTMHGCIWLIKRTLERSLGVQVVAIDPSVTYRKLLKM